MLKKNKPHTNKPRNAYARAKWLALGAMAVLAALLNRVLHDWIASLHLAVVIAAMLGLSNKLSRRHRGQLMGWFYLSLLLSFVLLIPLFG